MGQVKIEIPRDTTVKRYLSFQNFERLIKNQSLYFSRFDKFEDHLEGGINRRNYHNISNSLSIFDLAMQRWPSVSPRTEEETQALRKSETEIFENTFPSILGTQKKLDGDAFLKNISSWLYANCWTDLGHECQAMWQLYGSSGSNCRHDKGCQECAETIGNSVCIETTAGAIVDNLELPEGYNLTIRKVEYIDHRTSHFHEDDLVMRPYFSKALHFSYENEVRFMLWPESNDIKFSHKHDQSTINNQDNQQLKLKDLNSFIHRVILAPPPPSKIYKTRSLHMERFGTELGLEDELSNKNLKTKVEALFRANNLNINITESDLIQISPKDCYTLG
ncbi:hypothetical protein NP534_08175 [Pseudomonas sp. 39004]|uniref:hypothetical protein n=1 Tax=Pseudomonas sp. 39004 TaxID=2967213 RepID=UPI00236407DC|nr:hypothetical protein [Pseudomonas sp. 39004]MDD1960081.1 hypothetical protein [Pseudomonas sp. 39004]